MTLLTLAPSLHVFDESECCVLTPPCWETSFQWLIYSEEVSERPFILTTCHRAAENMLIYCINLVEEEQSWLHLFDLGVAKIRNTFITLTICVLQIGWHEGLFNRPLDLFPLKWNTKMEVKLSSLERCLLLVIKCFKISYLYSNGQRISSGSWCVH